MSSPQGPPPPDGDVDLGPRFMAVLLTYSIVAFLVVILRLSVRIKDRRLGMDDFCAFVAAVTFVGIATDVSYSAAHGTYRHIYYLTENQVELGLKTNTIAQALVAISQAFGKNAVAFLLIRLIGVTSRWRKWFLWTLIVLTFVISIITVFITFFQCRNPEAIWNVSLRATTSCWDPSVLSNEAIACSVWFTVVDFVLALFPITIVWGLQMSKRRKAALVVLFGLGILTGIFGALKISLIHILAHDSDASFQQYRLQIYSGTEGFLLIVLGCVPIIKRPWDHFIQHASNSPLITSLRRLVSQSAIGHQTDNTIQNRKYTRHDDSAYPLQNRLKANGSIGSAANEGFLYPESAEQPVRQENGISGQKVESVFQVV